MKNSKWFKLIGVLLTLSLTIAGTAVLAGEEETPYSDKTDEDRKSSQD